MIVIVTYGSLWLKQTSLLWASLLLSLHITSLIILMLLIILRIIMIGKKQNNIYNGYHHNNNGTQNNGPLMIVMIVIVNYGSLWLLANPKEIIWRFPKIVVPLNHLFLFGMFHEINHFFTIQIHPAMETPNFRKPSYHHLVGGFNLPLWKMMDNSSVGVMTFPICGKS